MLGHAGSPCSSGYISFSFMESRPREGNQSLWFILDVETNKTIFKSSEVRDQGSRTGSLCIPQTKDLQYIISIPPETATDTENSISIFGQHANRVFISPHVPGTKLFSLLDLIEPGSEWIHTCKHYEGWNTRNFSGKAEFVNPDSACSVSNRVEYYFKSFLGREHFAAYEIKFRYQAGIIAYLNGVEIYRDNLPDGELSPSTTSQSVYSSVSYRGTIRTGGEITCMNCFLAVAVYSEESALRKTVEDPSTTSFDAWLAVYHGSDSTSQAYIVPCLTTSLTRSPDYPFSPSFLVDYKLVPTPVLFSTSSIYLEVQTQHAQVSYWHVGSLLYNHDRLDERATSLSSFSSQSQRDSMFDEMTVSHRLVINPTVVVEEHTMDCLAYIVNDLDIPNPSHFKLSSVLSLPSSSSPMISENGGEKEEEMTFSLVSVILISVISILVFIILILIGVVIWICLKRRDHLSLPVKSLQSTKENSGKEQKSEKSSVHHGVPAKQQPQSQSQSQPQSHHPQPPPPQSPHPQPPPQSPPHQSHHQSQPQPQPQSQSQSQSQSHHHQSQSQSQSHHHQSQSQSQSQPQSHHHQSQSQSQPQPQPQSHHHQSQSQSQSHHHQERVTTSTEALIDKRNQTSQLSMRYGVPNMDPIQSYDESSSDQYYDQPEVLSIPIHNHHQYPNHPNPHSSSSSQYLEQPSMSQYDIPDPSSPQLRSARYYSPSHQHDQPYNPPARAHTMVPPPPSPPPPPPPPPPHHHPTSSRHYNPPNQPYNPPARAQTVVPPPPPPPPPPPSLPPTSSRHYNPPNQPYDPPARAQSVISLLPSRLNGQHKSYSSQSVYIPHPTHSSYHPNPRSVISPPSRPHNPPSDSQSVIPRS